jgi:hypothetical protein
MYMFQRKKYKDDNKLQDKVAGKLAATLLNVQVRVSNRMNRLKNLKWLVILFCMLSGSLSIFFLAEALVSVPKKQLHIDRVRIPQHLHQPEDTLIRPAIPADIIQQLQDYKRYMDSMGETIRPGLLDSMRVLEEIYSEQH